MAEPLIKCRDLAEMLAARDAVLVAWRRGVLDSESSQARLAALATTDADGRWWRLRPSPQGALFLRISPEGEVEFPDAEAYSPPPLRRPEWLRYATWGSVTVWALLWVTAVLAFLRVG